MDKPSRRLWLYALTTFLALGLASSVQAQLPGQLEGQIRDENDQPVADVEIIVTDPERPSWEQVEKSNKRGRYRIFFANATVPYELKLQKDGYQTKEVGGVRVTARKETRRDFTIMTQEAALANMAANPGSSDVSAEDAAKGGAAETFNKGVAALNAEDLDTAETLFLAALDKDSTLDMAHAALARLYLKQEKWADAAERAESAVAADVDVESMQQVLYASYSELGDSDKAQEALSALEAADPEKASKNIFNQAADAYNNGDMDKAREGLERVLSADPNHAKANYMMGLVLISAGENARAKEVLQKFLDLAPNDPDAGTAQEMLKYLE